MTLDEPDASWVAAGEKDTLRRLDDVVCVAGDRLGGGSLDDVLLVTGGGGTLRVSLLVTGKAVGASGGERRAGGNQRQGYTSGGCTWGGSSAGDRLGSKCFPCGGSSAGADAAGSNCFTPHHIAKPLFSGGNCSLSATIFRHWASVTQGAGVIAPLDIAPLDMLPSISAQRATGSATNCSVPQCRQRCICPGCTNRDSNWFEPKWLRRCDMKAHGQQTAAR